MFERANCLAGSSATLHALRHTAAYRMVISNIVFDDTFAETVIVAA
jgi:hypothetical protein